jgi:beta-lactamase class A
MIIIILDQLTVSKGISGLRNLLQFSALQKRATIIVSILCALMFIILINQFFENNAASAILLEMGSEEEQLSELPLRINDSLVHPLRQLTDVELQKKLDIIVASNKKWSRLVSDKKLCIGLVDLRDPYQAKYAHVNGNHMMYAASLPKIAVLLAAEDALEKGELKETEEIRADMRLMIAKSNNEATTRMIDRVGFEKIEEVMTDPRYAFYDEEYGGGLWVGKRYAQSGERHGDPLKNISHGASATQVCRYYYLLAYGKLINYDRSKEMLGYLGNPELHHKFVNTMDRVAPAAKVFRKSGSWRDYHSDSALVWGPNGRRYILVALAQDAEGENLMRNLMLEVDRKLNE